MDIPHRARPPMGTLPQIQIHDPSEMYRRSSRSTSYNSASSPGLSSIPMSIPNAREYVPPPLPPPRHLADIADGGQNGPDIAWKWGNSQTDSRDWGKAVSSVPQGSSLHGNNGSYVPRRGVLDEQQDFQRRGSSFSNVISEARDGLFQRDEGYESLGASVWSNKSKAQESLPSFQSFQSSVHDKYQSTAQAFDRNQIQKLDARRGSDNRTPPRSQLNTTFSSSVNDISPTSRVHHNRNSSQLKPLSLPILPGRPGHVESPLSRWADTPLSSAISPGNPYPRFGMQGQFETRSPIEASESNKSPLPCIKRSGSSSGINFDDDAPSAQFRRSYEERATPEHDDFHMEGTGFRRLHINECPIRLEGYSPGANVGQKRRASSPPGEDGPSLHTVGSASDLYRRRESASRASPTPRFHSTSGSVSSTASGPRNNSYASTLSVTASSITSMGSYGRLSPGGVSPGGISSAGSDMSDSPYVTSLSLNPSPRGSVSRSSDSRALSDSRPLMTSRKLSESLGSTKHSPPKVHGVFMCECCPKKPKKFDSQEDLTAHEQEKQYECAYCRNRFKNKNEAERHQNSLHLRRHSWSCATLSGYAAAFHNSPNRPNEADTCGYCGEDFPRSGISSPSLSEPPIAVASDQDWEVRIGHLQEIHKFGECNHAKKFFRADHFRQHLKHSHAGTSGKWTNMLENACMKDEPLPEPIRGPERVSPGGARVGRITEEDEMT